MVHKLGSQLNRIIAAGLLLTLAVESVSVSADTIKGEISLGGASYLMERYYNVTVEEDATSSLLVDSIAIPENIAISTAKNDYVKIRAKASTSAAMVGYLPKSGMCLVTGTVRNNIGEEWATIESGDVTGYIRCDMLYMNEAGTAKAETLAKLVGTVNSDKVKFRSTPDTDNSKNVLMTFTKGDELIVMEETIVNKECDTTLWVKAYYDDHEGYIAKQYVDLSYDWIKAVSMSSITGSDSLSTKRFNVVMEAMKYIGVLPYVWGGNHLTDYVDSKGNKQPAGVDCSGFCTQVLLNCGIDIKEYEKQRPTTKTMIVSKLGKDVASLDKAKPGDLIFYGDAKGQVDHVSMYLGNNQAVHARGTAYGVVVTRANYRTILKIRNFID